MEPCYHCGDPLEDGAERCPACGAAGPGTLRYWRAIYRRQVVGNCVSCGTPIRAAQIHRACPECRRLFPVHSDADRNILAFLAVPLTLGVLLMLVAVVVWLFGIPSWPVFFFIGLLGVLVTAVFAAITAGGERAER